MRPYRQPSAQHWPSWRLSANRTWSGRCCRAIHDRGLRLPDAAQRILYDGDEPIAIADFFYEPRIVVFVDGSPHHQDYVQAADDWKRRRLVARGYRIVVVRGEEMEAGLSDLASRLMS